jgi:hypothetical protein
MKAFVLAVTIWCLTVSAHAATLIWDVQPSSGGPITIERSTTQTGTYAAVATVPQGTTSYILTPGLWGHYRVRNTVGPSNTVQYSLDLYSGGLTDRLDTLEARVTVLEQPVDMPPIPIPTSTFTITHIDATHMRIVCAGVGITTLGSGTSRTMECRQ